MGKKTHQNKTEAAGTLFTDKLGRRKSSLHFEDKRPESIAQRKLAHMINNSPQAKKSAHLKAMAQQRKAAPFIQNPIQRQIKGISNWEEFVAAFKVENKGESPSPLLKTSVEAVIVEDKEYSFDDAFDRAMELALEEHEDEVKPVDVYVKVSELVPQLDPEQHKPGLVAHDSESGDITQKPTSPDSEHTHYKQKNLDDIRDVQGADDIDEEKVKSIFFELLEKNGDVPITTGDGRHRIAVYHAMGVLWIRASVTASQKTILEGRGITVQDKPD